MTLSSFFNVLYYMYNICIILCALFTVTSLDLMFAYIVRQKKHL